MEIWRNSDRNKRIENVKRSVFCRKSNAACHAYSEIFIYLIWKYEVLSKKNTAVGYICIFLIIYGVDLRYPASTYKLCEKDETLWGNFVSSKGNVLDFHVVKLYASGCSVHSHWIGTTVTRFCLQIMWKRWRFSVLFKKFSWCACCKVKFSGI